MVSTSPLRCAKGGLGLLWCSQSLCAVHALFRSSLLLSLMIWHPFLPHLVLPSLLFTSERLLYLYVPLCYFLNPLQVFLTFSGLPHVSCTFPSLLAQGCLMPAYHPLGYSPGGWGMHSLLAGEALLLRVQRLTVPPPRPKDFQHRMCSQPFPNVGLASLCMSHLGPVPMQARLGTCLRQALHG